MKKPNTREYQRAAHALGCLTKAHHEVSSLPADAGASAARTAIRAAISETLTRVVGDAQRAADLDHEWYERGYDPARIYAYLGIHPPLLVWRQGGRRDRYDASSRAIFLLAAAYDELAGLPGVGEELAQLDIAATVLLRVAPVRECEQPTPDWAGIRHAWPGRTGDIYQMFGAYPPSIPRR